MSDEMNEELLKVGQGTYPPWSVFDPAGKLEYVLAEPLRYYIAKNKDTNTWFICDRWTDTPLHGTQAETRTKSIRLFYEWCKRKMPAGLQFEPPVEGTLHDGPA
jgi:hypothetical protein